MPKRPLRALKRVTGTALTLSVALAPLQLDAQTPSASERRMAPVTGNATCDAAVDRLAPSVQDIQSVSIAQIAPLMQLGLPSENPPGDMLLASTLILKMAEVQAVRRACAGLGPAQLYSVDTVRQRLQTAARRGPPVCAGMARQMSVLGESLGMVAISSNQEELGVHVAEVDEWIALLGDLQSVCGTPSASAIQEADTTLQAARSTLAQLQRGAASWGGGSAMTLLRNGAIAAGQTRTGALERDDPVAGDSGSFADFYTFAGRRGQVVTVVARSAAFDAVLFVGGPGDFSQMNDDGPNMGTNAALTLTLPRDGEYRVGVTSLQPGSLGSYTLQLAEGRQVPPAPAPASGSRSSTPASTPAAPLTTSTTPGPRLIPGQPVSGTLANDDQRTEGNRLLDIYSFEGRRGQQVTVTLTSAAFDTALQVRGPQDFSQTNDDGPGIGTNSQLTLTLPADGRYEVRASSYLAQATGAYTLTLTSGATAPTRTGSSGLPTAATSRSASPAAVAPATGASGGSGASQPALLSFGAPAVGIISAMDPQVEASGRRHDLFAFDGRAGQRVRIAVDSRFFDTYAELLADSEVLAFNDDAAGRGTNSLIEHTLPRTGRYVVRVSPFRANGNDAGLYNVEVSEAGSSPAAPSGTVTMSGADLATTLSRATSVTPTRRINGLPVLEAGLVYRGHIAPGDDVVSPGQYSDSYVFEGRRGQRLTLTMRSSDVDATLAINNASGFRLYNDDGPNLGTHAQISAVLPADGLYTITASTYRASVGEYTIEVAAEAGSLLTSDAGEPTSEGQTVSGSLSATDDRFDPERYADRYSLDGRRGERVRITARSRAFDTRLVLRGPNNFEASNDDGPNMGTNSQLDATLPADGPYQLLITSFGPGMTGDYTINIVSERGGSSAAPPAPTPPAPTPPTPRPPPATPGTSGQVIRPGEVIEGEVRPGGSSGVALQFDAQIGERYSVVVEPIDPGFDPAVTVTGPDRRRHNGSNITRSNRTARIVFTASATGRHQILPRPDTVAQGAQSAGRYRVRLARHPMQTCPDDSSYGQAAAPDLRFGSGGTIGIGERVCGNLAPGDTPMMGAGTPWVDRWQVTLRSGQAVSVAASSPNLTTPVQWRIVAPANTPEPIVEPQPLDWLKVTARAAGRYTIEVYTEVPMVADYVLHVTPVNN